MGLYTRATLYTFYDKKFIENMLYGCQPLLPLTAV